MSYHIRIPLNGVVGFSQLIASESNMTDEVRKEYSSIIQKNSEELMRLVNDVLDLSRLEAGMMKFNIQEYGLTELCNEALYMAHMRNEENICIRLGNETAPGLDIRIDTTRFSQALLSTLTYPQKCEEKREIDFKVTHDTEKNMIRFRIINSPLADERFTSQEVYIRHEINRLLLEYFGGSYKVQANAGEKPTILFTYPLGKIDFFSRWLVNFCRKLYLCGLQTKILIYVYQQTDLECQLPDSPELACAKCHKCHRHRLSGTRQ